ncbi:gamma-glutamylcyclotransferase family protein [Spirosoma utsteinense]|uniref:Gamma-glutamylcyclotransferase AIG2-like domain-containing protein n=1 Tax=Spirosoma utsteinense TaxID=2585773 RepID=A0ABR6W119_9BACT|nr:gamma-glutamylcyclotransferase family protein [Spirosoma utsteinense]MBC3783625.1 gamma-glutamylcyclotransferase (GGCT)/AIG2-like putative protein YtfP [Spirosoma utsteinense]MBC3790233.1 gamma-glutamylcyclotransferase (GGCT)/AIG2-like putative protein YtfP [Spirosoma utsteinense]
MDQGPDYLLVYGTLRASFTNEAARFLHQRSRYIGEVSFPGSLFNLGTYPGAIYQPDSPNRVVGTVYAIGHHKSVVLAFLDEYEGIGPGYALPHEYIRVIVPVDFQSTRIDCWVYLYNHSTEDKRVIIGGDYTAYTTIR